MRRSGDFTKICVLLLAAAALVFGVARVRYFDRSNYAGDLKLRRNEICCSHTGVNPFHVWNREVKHPPFCGFSRPDFPEDSSGSIAVHNYPAWHTVFCWFYGWLPEMGLVWFYSLLYIGIVLLGWRYFHCAVSGAAWENQVLFWSLALLVFWPILCVSYALNYGLLMAVLYAVFIRCLDRNRDVAAGVLWALMMVKPQIAVLFFWPLLFKRRYIAILTAFMLCMGGVLAMSLYYCESPAALIMQIPQMGAPYTFGRVISSIRSFLPAFPWIWMLFCFLVCGLLSWYARRSASWFVRFFPALIVFPCWTYLQDHDLIMRWSIYLFIILTATGIFRFPRYNRYLRGLFIFAVCATVFPFAVNLVMKLLDLLPGITVAEPLKMVYFLIDAGNFVMTASLLVGFWQLLRQESEGKLELPGQMKIQMSQFQIVWRNKFENDF